MSEQVIAPEALYRLRRLTRTFLTKRAKTFWLTQHAYGEELPLVPPALAWLPAAERMRELGRDEAKRLSRSTVYSLDAQASDLAVTWGEAIRTLGHAAAVRAAGHRDVVQTRDIGPPAPFGFLRWAHSVGESHTKAPMIACHWGRIPQGLWVALWADNHVVLDLMKRQRSVPLPWRQNYLSLTGPLFYHHATLLRPHTPRPDALPYRPETDPCEIDVDDDTALIYTVLGTWAVLTQPGAAELIRHEPSRAEVLADHRAGITPSIVVNARGTAGAVFNAGVAQ